MTAITELNVLKATREWLSDPEHFTSKVYHEGPANEYYPFTNDPEYLNHVERTCAVGGIEHSIFLLAKQDGLESIIEFTDPLEGMEDGPREALIRETDPDPRMPADAPDYLSVYASAMARCNRLSIERYGNRHKGVTSTMIVKTFEDLTFVNWEGGSCLFALIDVLDHAIREVEESGSPKTPTLVGLGRSLELDVPEHSLAGFNSNGAR